MRNSLAWSLVATLALAVPVGLALAESPAPPSKNLKNHPNLDVAQKLAAQAFDKLELAQQAGEYDLGGHAAKARDLLRQAKAELDAAVVAGGSKKR